MSFQFNEVVWIKEVMFKEFLFFYVSRITQKLISSYYFA